MSMIPALQFDNWQWLSLQLATPGRALGRLAVPPRRLGEPQARRGDDGHADQPRRAGGVAVVAVRAVPRRRRRQRHADELRRSSPARAAAATRSTSRSASIVTTFILAGRYFEARAKRRAGAALQALLELGAKDVAVLDADGDRAPRRRSSSSPSATASSCARARRSRPTASSRRAPRPSTSRCSPASPCRSRRQPGDAVAGATINAGGRLVVRATQGRRGHRARADRAARDRGADRQGAGAAARRPHLRHLRARS